MSAKHFAIAVLGAITTVIVANPAAAQGACDRAQMQNLADLYVTAQEAGEGFRVPMGEWVQYRENDRLSSMTYGGVLATAHEVDWHRTFLDTTTCTIFVELIIDDSESPWVLGTKISTRGGLVNRYDVITTTTGDWLFNASRTRELAEQEVWDVIPEGQRNTRAEIIAAANAYLDRFANTEVVVPWADLCTRLEGSMSTARADDPMTCDLGIPEGIQLVDRDYIVDETIGAVAVRLRFGGPEGLSDAHIFRIENGHIRSIHTITNCNGRENCGFPPLPTGAAPPGAN
jgi:hypothetical protein